MSIIEKLGITPGPWDYQMTHNTLYQVYRKPIGNNAIAKMLTCFDSRGCNTPKIEAMYNGYAISALPELLEVVIELMACSEYWSEYDVPVGIHDRIKNAVEKATGRKAGEVLELYNENT